MRRTPFALLICLALASACSSNRDDDTDTDAGTSDDAGTTDAGTTDAGSTDAGSTDAGSTDAGDVTLTLPTTTPVPIRFGECTAPAACGGDPMGVWTYTDYCVPDPFAQLKQLCAGLEVKSITGTVNGAAAFGGGRVLRHAEVSVDATVDVPVTCTTFIGGCPGLENVLAQAGFTATCTANGALCNCEASQDRTADESGAYAVSGATLTTGGRSYEFCVTGTTLEYTDKTSGGSAVPGTGILTKN